MEEENIVEVRVRGSRESSEKFADALSEFLNGTEGRELAEKAGVEVLDIANYRAELVNVEESEGDDDGQKEV